MKHNCTQLNPYQITWITFRPIGGQPIVTQHDQALLRKEPRSMISNRVKDLSIHFPTEELAFQRLGEVRDLDKEYEFFIYTDKQFGMWRFGEPVESILTAKQIADRGVI